MPREGSAGSTASALGSREGAEVRALGLVIPALICLGPKLPAPLDCLRVAGLHEGKVLGVFLSSAKDIWLSSFLGFHLASLEAEQTPEHKTLGSPWAEVSIGRRSSLHYWSLSPPVNAPKLPNH